MLNLNAEGKPPKKMWIELIASSGSTFIHYEAYNGDDPNAPQSLTIDKPGVPPVKFDITALAQGATLLYPYTTTLVEVFVEREPMPLGQVSTIFTFPELM
jgi:hypothetical protein